MLYMHTLSHQKNWVRCHTKGENSKKYGLVLQMVVKTGFVPPFNLRSESASIIWMELKYFLKDKQLFRYISYIPNNSYCGNAGGYYRTD